MKTPEEILSETINNSPSGDRYIIDGDGQHYYNPSIVLDAIEAYHAQFEGECDFTELVGKIETHIETTKECMDNFNTPDYVNELLKQDNQLFLEIINKIKRV